MDTNMYDDPILQWANRRDHLCTIEHPDRQATATNALCGDKVTIQLQMDGPLIKHLYYSVKGCLLCKASCAHLAHIAGGLDPVHLKDLRDTFERYLKSSDEDMIAPSGYELFSPVRTRRSRHRCVLLPYEATLNALF